jgi:hypothetical protein
VSKKLPHKKSKESFRPFGGKRNDVFILVGDLVLVPGFKSEKFGDLMHLTNKESREGHEVQIHHFIHSR